MACSTPSGRDKVGVAPTNASFQSYVTAYRVIEGEGAAEAWVSGLVANDPEVFEGNTPPSLRRWKLEPSPWVLINHYYWYRLEAERGDRQPRLPALVHRTW